MIIPKVLEPSALTVTRLPNEGDIVVVKGWGMCVVQDIDFERQFPYRVQNLDGWLVPCLADDVTTATDVEILAARLQGLCPSLTS